MVTCQARGGVTVKMTMRRPHGDKSRMAGEMLGAMVGSSEPGVPRLPILSSLCPDASHYLELFRFLFV